MISFVIPGRIGGKGRPKFSTAGGFARAYTPARTRSMEAVVRDLGAKAIGGRMPLEGPIGLQISIVQIPPPSWSHKKRKEASWVTGRPDTDNIVKLIGDSLNNIIWKDDSQISAIHFERRYALSEPGRVEVAVFTLGFGPWNRM